MQNLPPDFFPKVSSLLTPHMDSEGKRDALLTQAFFLTEPRLYHQIKREGSTMEFVTLCIKTLLTFGCLINKTHSLSVLLNTLRYHCGIEQQQEIDNLIPVTNTLCGEVVVLSNTPQQAPVQPQTPQQNITTPAPQRTPTVFISYSHRDDAIVQRLMNDLNTAGHACWVDTTGIKGGDEWMRSICEGINNSYAFVIVCTVQALQSRWVRDEILWARQKNKFIIPALLEEAVIGDDNFFGLHTYQGAKLYEGYDTALRQLTAVMPAPTISNSESDESETIVVRASERKVSQRELELEYLDRLRFEELLNTEKYTPLAGQSQLTKESTESYRSQAVVMRPEFIHSPWARNAEQQRETRRFDNAVDEIIAIQRVVVLGEPGAGKTTTLWKLARNLVDTAIADPQAAIPLLVRLGKWTDETQSLADFIASQLGGLGVHLTDLLQERAVLLLDGLNEIPVAQRKAKDAAVQQFIEDHADLMAVVTCRAEDYKKLDLGFDRIEIAPLNPLRIREFVERYLGIEAGDVLFWKLAGEKARVQETSFLEAFTGKLDAPQAIFWTERELPEGMKWGWWSDDNTYWRGWLQLRDHPSSLMVLAKNPYMLFMLTDVYTATGDLPANRGQLFRDFVETLFVREGIASRDKTSKQVALHPEAQQLFEALCNLAFEMQVQRSQQKDGNAVTVLSLDDVRRFLNSERLEYLAASTSIVSLGAEVRFTHQLLQEYFAAVTLNRRIFERSTPLQAAEIWQSDKWWERTNWEEAVILLAGLYSDDCTKVLEWVEQANPEVATQCIVKSGAYTPDATLIHFRDRWLPRLTDLRSDPQPEARAAVGRALGQLTLNGKPLDSRKGISVTDEGIPDIDWVEIPAGEFIYGDDNKDDYPDWGKPADRRKLKFPSFYMSRYPVTYVQFQAFVDAPDGYSDAKWWDGLAKREAKPGEQYFKFSNNPAENISWYDAIAFCRWLSAKVGYEVRLPTEFEWERAARGTRGREYPWGNGYQEGASNIDEVNSNVGSHDLQQTSAVGIYPQGKSPEGLLDMSGNVWEWCATDYANPKDRYEDEDLSVDSSRVLRGGSWSYSHNFARAAYPVSHGPYVRLRDYGFRVLCRF